MQLRTTLAAVALATGAMTLGVLGASAIGAGASDANTISVAPQTPVGDTSPDAGGGFWSAAGVPIASASVGDSVQVLVTSVQTNPDPFTSNGTFSVTYDPAQFAFTGDSAGGPCDTATAGVVSCTESGVENASAPYGKTDSFGFTVLGAAGTTDSVTASVEIDGVTASATFSLALPEATVLTAHPYVASILPGLDLYLKPSATLTAGGAPLAGVPVTFTAGSSTICTATTNSAGLASCDSSISALLGFEASFAGTGDYLASQSSGATLELAGLAL